MVQMFEQVLHASFYGGILILAVCLLRLLLKNAPKRLTCLLWLLVGLRLLLPFEIRSDFSLQPKLPQTEQTARIQPAESDNEARGEILNVQGEVLATRPMNQGGGEILDSQGNVLVTQPLKPAAADKKVTLDSLLPWLWLAGVAVMGVYSLAAYLRLKRRVRDCIVLEEGIWFCPGLDTAFVLGILRPQIYLPGLAEAEMGFVVAHEKAHIARKDHWWKFLGYAALAVHWFNPLVWLGYVLLCRDLERACDEAVIRALDLADRKAYSQALLSCAARHSLIGACPVAFGEVSVGERIKSVMNYKKPKFWICLLAVLSVIVAAVCFLTVPSTEDEEIAARLGGNVYTWEKKYADVFSFEIELDEDGTCYFVDGVEPYRVGLGEWSVKNGILKIRDDLYPSGTGYFCFKVEEDDLVFLGDKSASFEYTKVSDGDRFYKIEDMGNGEERLAQCEEAFGMWSAYEDYHINQYNVYTGTAVLNPTSQMEYWKSGEDWLCVVTMKEVDNGRAVYYLKKDGVEYRQELYETLTDNPQGWPWSVAEESSDCMKENWIGQFNWRTATIRYESADTINNNIERVTLTVVEDPSVFGKYCPYTVNFYFDAQKMPLRVGLTLDENKGERDWQRINATFIITQTLDADGPIDAAYVECMAALGKDSAFLREKCEDRDCTDSTHDHSARDCVDPNCTNTDHDHYGIACTVEHCDNPAHGHGDHDHH